MITTLFGGVRLYGSLAYEDVRLVLGIALITWSRWVVEARVVSSTSILTIWLT